MSTSETTAMANAYECLKSLDRPAWQRALKWIEARLFSDHLSAEATAIAGTIRPQRWGPIDDPGAEYESADDVAEDFAEAEQVLEINGHAVVERKFCVRILTCDLGGNVDGDELMWFDTREAAEACVKGAPVDCDIPT